MIFRLLLVFLIILLQNDLIIKSEEKRLKISFVILFIFAGLRGTGDGDYYNYLEFTGYINTLGDVMNNGFPMEIGFRILAFISNSLNMHPQFVIATMNLISLIFTYILIKTFSQNKMFSVFLFLPLFFQFDMHAARMAVAISISTYSLKYLLSKDFIRYSGIIILSSLFHQSSLIMIPLYFIIVSINSDKIKVYSTIVITLLSSILSFSMIIYNLLKLTGFSRFAGRFYAYMNSIEYGYPFKLYDPRLILLVITLGGALYYLKKRDWLTMILLNITWINVIIVIIFRESTTFVTRFSSFLNIYSILVIPYIIKNIPVLSRRKIILNTTYTLFFLYIMRFVLVPYGYKFYFL